MIRLLPSSSNSSSSLVLHILSQALSTTTTTTTTKDDCRTRQFTSSSSLQSSSSSSSSLVLDISSQAVSRTTTTPTTTKDDCRTRQFTSSSSLQSSSSSSSSLVLDISSQALSTTTTTKDDWIARRCPFPRGRWLTALLAFFLPLTAHADPGIRLDLPQSEAWTGQRLSFFIELRADGSFTGAPSFDIPPIPNTVVLKTGSPVLGSLTEDGTEFLTQRHEFALFSQADGAVELPAITARFSHRKGYTGPSFDVSLATEPATVTIRRPPGSESLGFLITTDALTIEETWSPEPGPLEIGTVLKRTITQRAAQMTGIALAPAPTAAPAGVRVYAGDPEVTDNTERGALSGERRETITYLIQQPGLHTLPAIQYNWWNPNTESIESKTLPAVTFTATAPPQPPTPPSPARFLWWIVPLAVLGGGFWFRAPIAAALHRLRDRLDPPARRATRALLHSCARNDAPATARCWADWQRLHPDFTPAPELQRELVALHRQQYGPSAHPAPWIGDSLAVAIRAACTAPPRSLKTTPLPRLNS